jgi:hypothetical protein
VKFRLPRKVELVSLKLPNINLHLITVSGNRL